MRAIALLKGENIMLKLLIGADVVPTSATEDLFVKGDARALFGKICDLAKDANRVIINLEAALTNHDGKIAKFGPNIKGVPECTAGLKALGVTDVMLSNNHVFDFGIKGLRDTMKALDDAGLPYTGVGENDTDSRKAYYFEAKGKKIGIINVCEHEYTYALPNRLGANPFDPFLTMHDIRECKKNCDHVIVIYHGGKEHCRYPSPRLVNLCHEMIECGAEVVLTQHSHCIGTYECYEGGHIVYGQGNFCFSYPEYSDKGEGWYTSLLVELDIEDDVKIKFHPIYDTYHGCDLAEGEKAEEIISDFEERNKSMLDGTWRDGWHAFCVHPDREYYHDKVVNACENEQRIQGFAHYLDCEAHTDVWRELYPTWNMTNEL